MRVVGLMSGTSLDGIDAVLVEIESPDPSGRPAGVPGSVGTDGSGGAPPVWRVLGFETVPFTPEQRRRIHDVITAGRPETVASLHAALGGWLAEATLGLCRATGLDPADVDVIGSHGQTVWHRPPTGGGGEGTEPAGAVEGEPAARGHTLQLGDPATIAEVTGIPVVSDFRSRDVAAGGHGAPLVPWVDALLFSGDTTRTLLNIGGIANVTRVPPRGSTEPIVAFDTGPGNAVIDAAMALATGGARLYDANGEWARRGHLDQALMEALLADPYFRRPPPKSTGRERFGARYVEALVSDRRPSDRDAWAGLVATLTSVVAVSIADAIRRWADPGAAGVGKAEAGGSEVDDGGRGTVLVTGGGAENPVLVERLRAALDPMAVRPGDVLGVDPAAKEALAFAVLAWAHVTGRPANVPSVTGAAGPRVLGSLTPGGEGRLPADGRAP